MLHSTSLEYAKCLEDSGVSRESAEMQTAALAEMLDVRMQNFATKADLRELKAQVNGDFKTIEAKIDGVYYTIKWMLGMIILAIVVPLVKLLFSP